MSPPGVSGPGCEGLQKELHARSRVPTAIGHLVSEEDIRKKRVRGQVPSRKTFLALQP